VKKVDMKILDLPIEQIRWLLAEFNEIEGRAFKLGFSETTRFLNEGKLVSKLLQAEDI
jgi:hypothetical protein